MTNTEKNVADLKKLFKTDNIFNESTAEFMTDSELNDIIDIIHIEKTDNIFNVIGNRLKISLESGKVYIRDIK